MLQCMRPCYRNPPRPGIVVSLDFVYQMFQTFGIELNKFHCRALQYCQNWYFDMFIKTNTSALLNIDITTHLHKSIIKYPNHQNYCNLYNY